MTHRPSSLPDFQPNQGFGIESHFGGTVQATKPQPQYQRLAIKRDSSSVFHQAQNLSSRRHVSPTKSAPVSTQDRSDFLEPVKNPKPEAAMAITRLNAPTKTDWQELIG